MASTRQGRRNTPEGVSTVVRKKTTRKVVNETTIEAVAVVDSNEPPIGKTVPVQEKSSVSVINVEAGKTPAKEVPIASPRSDVAKGKNQQKDGAATIAETEQPPEKPREEKHAMEGEVKKETKRRKGEREEEEKKRKRRKKRWGYNEEMSGYGRYVFRVLKQVHPDLAISSKAMAVLNAFMWDMFERLAGEAGKLADYTRRATLSSREIQDAVRLVLPGELGKHAISEGSKAVTNYVTNDD